MQAFTESELRYRRLFDTTQDGILILDASTGVIEDVNLHLMEMLDHPREHFVAKNLWDVYPFNEENTAVRDVFEGFQKNEYTHYGDLRIKADGGKIFQMEFVINVYPVDNENVIQCYIHDVSEYTQMQDRLFKNEILLQGQTILDPLTGLFNRPYMEATLDRELLRASRKQLSVGVIMLDVDNFQRFNDNYDQAAGDALLCGLSNFLLKHVRGEDIVCRYGGDEFVLVMPDASRKVTWERAEDICTHVRQFHFQFGEQPLEAATLSIGVAVLPDDGNTVFGILKTVETALHYAKREGCGRVFVA